MKRFFLLVAGVMCLLLAGCGDDDSGKDGEGASAVDLLSQSVEKAVESEKVGFSFSLEIEGGEIPRGMSSSFEGDGMMDLVEGNFSFEAPINQLLSPAGISATAGDPGLVLEVRLIDNMVYLRFPPIPGVPQTSKPWAVLTEKDLRDLAVQQGADPDDLKKSQDEMSPLQWLEFLEDVSGDVTEIRQERVRGVMTTVYNTEIDYGQLQGQEKPFGDLDPEVEAALAEVKFPVVVWIDKEGFLRKYSIEVNSAEFPEAVQKELPAEEAKVAFSMDLYDYDADSTVEVPPAGEVGSFFDLFGDILGDFPGLETFSEAV